MTRLPESHMRTYISVVHGSTKNPSSGTRELSNARLNRLLKSQTKNSASRGDSRAMRTTRQGMARGIARHGALVSSDMRPLRFAKSDLAGLGSAQYSQPGRAHAWPDSIE